MRELRRVLFSWKTILTVATLLTISIYIQNTSSIYDPMQFQTSNKVYDLIMEEVSQVNPENRIGYLERKAEEMRVIYSLKLRLEEKREKTAEYQLLRDEYARNSPDLVKQIESGQISISSSQANERRLAYGEMMEKVRYVTAYNHYYEKIMDEAKKMFSVSIFSDKNSFSYRNIHKTVNDFKPIETWKIRLENTRVEDSLFESEYTDYILLIFIVILVLSFLQERKSSMWMVVHASVGGRDTLAIKRVIVLFLGSSAMTILLFLTKIYVAQHALGRRIRMDIPIQNISRFRYVPEAINLGDFLLKYLMIRILTIFIAGLLLWLLLSLSRNLVIAMVFTVLVLAAQYGLFVFVSDSSILVPLKFLNFFTLITPKKLFENYLNINILGYPVNVKNLIVMLIPFTIVLLCISLVVYHQQKRPLTPVSKIEVFTDKFRMRINPLFTKLGLGEMELYKTLFPLKGWAVIVLFLYFMTGYSGVPSTFIESKDYVALKYYTMYQGPVSEKTLSELRQLLTNKEGSLQEQSLQESNPEYFEGVNLVLADAERIAEINRSEGEKLELTAPYAIQSLWGEQSEMYHQQQNVRFSLVIVLLFSGVFAYEKEKKMLKLLLSSQEGREVFLQKKILANLGILCILFGGFYSIEVLSANEVMGGLVNLSAPARSLRIFEGLNGSYTLGFILAYFYIVRLLGYILLFFLVSLLSLFFSKVNHSMIAMLIFFILPMALTSMGESLPLTWTSLLYPQEIFKLGWWAPVGTLFIVCLVYVNLKVLLKKELKLL